MKLHRGDVLLVRAVDHNGHGEDNAQVVFVGVFGGRIIREHRRFIKLLNVYYPEGRGWIGIADGINVIEREVTRITKVGRIDEARGDRRSR